MKSFFLVFPAGAGFESGCSKSVRVHKYRKELILEKMQISSLHFASPTDV